MLIIKPGVNKKVFLNTNIQRSMIAKQEPRTFTSLAPSILTSCLSAYATRRLFPSYTGPVLRVRRDSDNAEANVWMDYNGDITYLVPEVTTGGTVTYDASFCKIHTFTTNDSFVAANDIRADILVVGGGGGGGLATTFVPAGGGGGGEVVYKTNIGCNTATYGVTIGPGGAGGTLNPVINSKNGSSSVFGGYTATGGGAGGNNGTQRSGNNGGSGGGGSRSYAGGVSIASQGIGKNGGSSGGVLGSSAGGGGGGGASQAGFNSSSNNGANGGQGLTVAISGSSRVYGSGGGGGARSNVNGTGGTNAGGQGSPNAVANYGGGGGGGQSTNDASANPTSNPGGNGGSGVVIVRVLNKHGLQGRNALNQWLGSSTASVITWYDQKDGNHVTTIRGNPRLSTYPNDTYLYGDVSGGFQFPAAILPSTYTLFHVAQYAASGTKGRIIDGVASNWLSGFSGGDIGIAYHDALITNATNDVSNNALMISTDQNSPDLYRYNGINRTTVSSSSTTTQLSINYGQSAQYSDWIVREVLVFNKTLNLSSILSIEKLLMNKYMGILDKIPTSTLTYSAFALSLRLLTISYTGPVIRVRRNGDSTERDFYANFSGDIGDEYLGRGQRLEEWLKGSVGYVTTWYDQSGKNRHAYQTTTAKQPVINRNKFVYYVSFDGTSSYMEVPSLTTAPREYPPVALGSTSENANGQTISASYGSGAYKVSRSSRRVTSSNAYNAFNKNISSIWQSVANYTNGLPNVNASSLGGINGEWIQLELPNSIQLEYIQIISNTDNESTRRGIRTFELLGSNDGANWTTLDVSGNNQTVVSPTRTYNVFRINNNSNFYKIYAIVSTSVGYLDINSTCTGFGEWELYGYDISTNAYATNVTANYSFIVNARGASSNSTLFTSTTPLSFSLATNASGIIQVRHPNAAETSVSTLNTNIYMSSSKASVIAAQYNGTTLSATINKTPATGAATFRSPFINKGMPFIIGGDASSSYFAGDIFDVMYFGDNIDTGVMQTIANQL